MLMTRARRVLAASLVLGGFAAGLAYAQQSAVKPPPMELVLAGKKYTPPLRGQAPVEFTTPTHKRDGKMVVTTIRVRNPNDAPIARLKIDEPWYDKNGDIVVIGSGVINGLLQPGEVADITYQVPFNSKMQSNNYNFSHANGDVKPQKVDKLPEPEKKDEAAAAPSQQ
jgi:hypothetical protein